MLVRLLPEQIGKYWNVIKYSLEHTFPAGTRSKGEKLNFALEELLVGKHMHAWACVRENAAKEDYDVIGIVLTSVVTEVGTKIQYLRILVLFAFEDVPISDWKQGLVILRTFADSIGCDAIDGYTDMPSVIAFVKAAGGDTSRTYVQLRVKE
jgi:hypothetical protein